MAALYGFAYSEAALKYLETKVPVKIRNSGYRSPKGRLPMTASKGKEENPRMKAADFERILSQALQVSPPKDKKAKGAKKTKKTTKKKTKRKASNP